MNRIQKEILIEAVAFITAMVVVSPLLLISIALVLWLSNLIAGGGQC